MEKIDEKYLNRVSGGADSDDGPQPYDFGQDTIEEVCPICGHLFATYQVKACTPIKDKVICCPGCLAMVIPNINRS